MALRANVVEDAFVEEDQGAEGLVLCRGGEAAYLTLCGVSRTFCASTGDIKMV